MTFMRFSIIAPLVVGCGPTVETPAGSGTGSGDASTAAGDETSSTSSETASTVDPTSEAGVTTIADSGGESSTTGQADTSDFIGGVDVACVAGHEDPRWRCSYECSPWAQDCPEGEKCSPWSNDGSNVFNAARCSPVADLPDSIGDPCTVEGHATSGLDSCGIDSMCWSVDATNREGVCVAFCQPPEAEPLCPEATQCLVANGSWLSVCLPTCHPLDAGACPADEGCHRAADDQWMCMPQDTVIELDVSGRRPTECEPGFTDIPAASTGGCMEGDATCCAALCSLADPQCDPQFSCVALYDDPPTGLEQVGVCILQ